MVANRARANKAITALVARTAAAILAEAGWISCGRRFHFCFAGAPKLGQRLRSALYWRDTLSRYSAPDKHAAWADQTSRGFYRSMIGAKVRSSSRHHLKSIATASSKFSTTGIDSVQEFNWKEFESLLSEAFRRQGFTVELAGGAGPEGGVDLRLRKAGRLTLVQCKHCWEWQVGVTPICIMPR